MLICLINVDGKHLCINMKVRIYAGVARFVESVGIRRRFGRALLGQVGVRLGQSRSPGEPGRTIYI